MSENRLDYVGTVVCVNTLSERSKLESAAGISIKTGGVCDEDLSSLKYSECICFCNAVL